MITFLTSTTIVLVIALFLIGKTIWNIGFAVLQKKRGPDKAHLYAVELLRPMVFFKLSATALTIPFFSHYIVQIATAHGYSTASAAWVYAFYQITFLLALIPGGYIADTRNPKRILLIATLIEALIFAGLFTLHNIWALLILQGLFGCIIPFSASAEYAYIFHCAQKQNRHEAISLYLNSMRGAMISGTTLGGILAMHFSYHHIFGIAACMVGLCAWYIAALLPQVRVSKKIMRTAIASRANLLSTLRTLPMIFKNPTFLCTILLVALPLGLLQEGVIRFSLPITLRAQHLSHAIIGELIVAFSIGFFITNRWAAKRADAIRTHPDGLIVLGLLGTAACTWGLSYSISAHWTIALINLLALGMCTGFVLTPALTYTAHSPVSQHIGKNLSVSIYRTSETIGRVAGPLFIGQWWIWQHHNNHVYTAIAIGLAFCAGLYVLIRPCRRTI